MAWIAFSGAATPTCMCIPKMSSRRAACGDRREDRVDVLDEVPRLGIEQLILLLDAERVRVAPAERVVEHAGRPAGRSLGALARDRRRVDLLHAVSITASASISTSQRGSRSCVMMPVVAGR